MLSGRQIIEAREKGDIIIERFNRHQVQPNSYDIRIGNHIARFRKTIGESPETVSLDLVDRELIFKIEECTTNILILSGERILCHTEEFFGSANGSTPCLATRSTLARLGLDICGSAGFGDVGYINRWTLELQNNSPYHYRLPVGARVGQVYFNEVEERAAWYTGSYVLDTEEYSYEQMLENWVPTMMLPKEVSRG